jgi:integrase
MNPTIERKPSDGVVKRLKQANMPNGLSKFWYACYSTGGRYVKVNTETEDYQEACDQLAVLKDARDRGEQPVKKAKAKYEDLRALLISDYKLNHRVMRIRKDGKEEFAGRKHMDVFFEDTLVSLIDTRKLREYIDYVRAKGIKDPTIRRHLVCLKAAFNMAKDEGMIANVPKFPMPQDSEPAGKNCTPAEFESILANMPEKSRLLFKFMFHCGLRGGAAMKITWPMVAPDCSEIVVPGRLMKAKEPLSLPMVGVTGLGAVAEELKKMFRVQGKPVFYAKNFRNIWNKAVKAAGVGKLDEVTGEWKPLRIHDTRVAAIRSMIKAGVPRKVAMAITGHKTEHVFNRYHIVENADVKEALIRSAAYVAANQG